MPTPTKYQSMQNWKLDGKYNSNHKNPMRAIIGKETVDVLKKTYGLKEKMNVPAPGHYRSEFSEFSGVYMS